LGGGGQYLAEPGAFNHGLRDERGNENHNAGEVGWGVEMNVELGVKW
jgi:hypothetical protein